MFKMTHSVFLCRLSLPAPAVKRYRSTSLLGKRPSPIRVVLLKVPLADPSPVTRAAPSVSPAASPVGVGGVAKVRSRR